MSVKFPALHVKQFARAQPVALIVGHKQPPIEVEAQPVGRAETGRKRRHFALRGDLQHPAAVRRGRVHSAGRPPVAAGLESFARQSVVAKLPPQLRPDARSTRGQIQTDVQVAARIPRRPKGELVVVAGHAKIVAHRFVLIRLAVAVGVSDARQLRPLHDDDFTVVYRHDAKRLLQSIGE